MPRRNDLHRILIIGSGPIIIGQACEFDYSGAQACKALRSEGYEVILINSNPATIMTDPNLADKTYIEPLSVPSPTKSSAGTSRCPALYRRRPDRPEPCRRPRRSRGTRKVRRRTAHCSHMMDVVEKVSDRIVLINNGTIIANGTIDELKQNSTDSLEQIFSRLTSSGNQVQKADDLAAAMNG